MGRFVVSVQGGQAVGKTTLVKKLQQRYPDVYFEFENPYPLVQKRQELKLDITTEAGFLENQRLFIEAECQRFRSLIDGKIVLDRGPEDIEFYTLHYPASLGACWDIEKLLSTELAELRLYRSDRILYLQANLTTLASRKECDTTRSRRGFAHYLEYLHFREESWFLALPQTVCINVDSLISEQVEATVSQWLEAEWNQTV